MALSVENLAVRNVRVPHFRNTLVDKADGYNMDLQNGNDMQVNGVYPDHHFWTQRLKYVTWTEYLRSHSQHFPLSRLRLPHYQVASPWRLRTSAVQIIHSYDHFETKIFLTLIHRQYGKD